MSTGAQTNLTIAQTGSSKVVTIFSGDNAAADEGSYFVASTPASAPTVGGTAIATTTSVVDDAATQSATHAQSVPVILIKNQWPVGNPTSMNIYLRYIKMAVVQVPTSASIWSYAMRMDPLSTKLTTAGTVLVPQNVNSSSGTVSNAYITVGAITCVIASANSRLTGNGTVCGAIPVAQDQWNFTFGDPVGNFSSMGVQTSAKQLSLPCAPQIIAPGMFWTLEMWGASCSAAPSFVFEIGYIERPSGQ